MCGLSVQADGGAGFSSLRGLRHLPFALAICDHFLVVPSFENELAVQLRKAVRALTHSGPTEAAPGSAQTPTIRLGWGKGGEEGKVKAVGRRQAAPHHTPAAGRLRPCKHKQPLTSMLEEKKVH